MSKLSDLRKILIFLKESLHQKLKSPLIPHSTPLWPPGDGFTCGTINLGELQVAQISTFFKVWASYEGDPENIGATIFEPMGLPEGFSMLGYYSQPDNKPFFGWVIVTKDNSSFSNPALTEPLDYTLYTLIWITKSLKINLNSSAYFWQPNSPEGIFLVQNGGNTSLRAISCLKNTNVNFTSMPNLQQFQAIVQVYSPIMYLHPDEEYHPSSVNWFFANGGLLYKKGYESHPTPIQPNGTNLPQDPNNDGSYWLHLPADEDNKERVKRGELQSSQAYMHIKTMFGGTFTHIACWVYYPFNGPAREKVEFITISLGKIGEHVGDWEHVTLRVSKFDGDQREQRHVPNPPRVSKRKRSGVGNQRNGDELEWNIPYLYI
ncbi:hypothetical protein K1719_039913 [Acacia pycnantha]|nr:hypothetical protein K1719_039913 [Acacia pycnantha]